MTQDRLPEFTGVPMPTDDGWRDAMGAQMVRYLAVVTTERGALNCSGRLRGNPAAEGHSDDALKAEWALCHVLRSLPEDLADRLAEEVRQGWVAGSNPYEDPPAWMAEYGMDPELTIARGRGDR